MAEPGRVVSEPAPAKLNPFLRVLGRRSDGFHDIETLGQPVTLADGVRAETADAGLLSLSIAGEQREAVPRGDDNLVLRAARELLVEVGPASGARLLLVKRIPVAAGLGGGSADAAAALRALNDLWGVGLTSDALADIGARVGSDVPALVHVAPVIARGRGEDVEPVDLPRTWWIVLPASGVSAAESYAAWDEDARDVGPDVAPLLEAMRSGDLDAVAGYLFNDLEAPVAERHAEVARRRQALLEAGAIGAIMCGSGPSVAGLALDGTDAERIANAVGGIAVSAIGGRPA
ncbi:MAG TPA: 4-(cytidine 5'-diphospho)-2-C-methyl-D-erythritol kinase [Actinomycetota bacterium]|nr:4-(cytidine 5'-diphospho)-2-C-methyl-D-erythritol kinase [Actinomycetota bacterium]